jgi:hypothetical protein
MITANITPAPPKDGLPYAVNAAVPTSESDLFNQGAVTDPTPALLYGSAISAVVEFTAGPGATAPTYCVLQTEWADGVWVDVAFCLWQGTSGSAQFVLSAGSDGANAFQQTRQPGTPPAGNGSNQCPLGGRIRFVGQSGKGAGASPSSPSAGAVPMQVSIRWKRLALR